MGRYVLGALAAVLASLPTATAADPPKDTTAAHFTRTKKLKGKVTVDFKNEFLKAVFEGLSEQLADQKLGPISVQYGTGVSQNTRITFSAKDVAFTDEAATSGRPAGKPPRRSRPAPKRQGGILSWFRRR